MGFEVEGATGVLQQVAVLHLWHRCTGGGGDVQLTKLVLLPRRQGRHLLEAQLAGLGGSAGGGHHRQGLGQQRQAGRVAVVVEPLGEQQ